MRQSVFRIQKFGSEFKILFKCLFQISDKVSSEKSRVPSPPPGRITVHAPDQSHFLYYHDGSGMEPFNEKLFIKQ